MSSEMTMVAIGLFLLITVLISSIIVIFISKIHRLESILDQAKVINDVKEERLSEFYEAFQEERKKTTELEKELEEFSRTKDKIKEFKVKVEELKEVLLKEREEHRILFYQEQSALEQLQLHYELLEQTYLKQERGYSLLQKRNEVLVKENNMLHLSVRKIQIQMEEQEKLKMLKQHRGE